MSFILLGSSLSNFATLEEVRKWFRLSNLSVPPTWELEELLARYRAAKTEGLGKIDIVIRWKREGVEPMTAAAFVNAMERIEGGIMIQDPTERPSMAEILSDYKRDIQKAASAFPYVKIAFLAAGALALYAFAGGLAKGIVSK